MPLESADRDRRNMWECALTESRDDPHYYNQLWLDLIEIYCQMYLSYETDRLMAIQGLVDQVPPSNREDNGYIAGLFKLGLVKGSGLAWCNSTPRTEKATKFPSWSWASLGAGDLFFWHLEEVFTTVKSVNNFDISGQDVRSDGRLQLTGPLQEIHTSLLQDDNGSRIAIINKTYPFEIYFTFDTIGGVVAYEGSITLLALGVESGRALLEKNNETAEKHRRVIGLVLWPTGCKAREYIRIGEFHVTEIIKTTVWDHESERDIEIV
jgi:hypothetical protein